MCQATRRVAYMTAISHMLAFKASYPFCRHISSLSCFSKLADIFLFLTAGQKISAENVGQDRNWCIVYVCSNMFLANM